MAISAERVVTDDRTRETICVVFCFASVIVLVPWMSSGSAQRTTSFSVNLTEIGGLNPVQSLVIRPAFDLTIRVDNYMDTRLCTIENATVTLSYGSMVLGLGNVPDFCVNSQASAEIKAVLTQNSVVLTDQLRRAMASELRAGELKISVEMRMLFPKGYDYECQSCEREILHYCRVRPGLLLRSKIFRYIPLID
ncbi:hypothetical protein QOZ80_1BG0070030 [Eleusine coracana subsp. coracana]|nr:hypothetical protein QOZ80_1BG0070030 [Eleusine coracana subsp. coracana]